MTRLSAVVVLLLSACAAATASPFDRLSASIAASPSHFTSDDVPVFITPTSPSPPDAPPTPIPISPPTTPPAPPAHEETDIEANPPAVRYVDYVIYRDGLQRQNPRMIQGRPRPRIIADVVDPATPATTTVAERAFIRDHQLNAMEYWERAGTPLTWQFRGYLPLTGEQQQEEEQDDHHNDDEDDGYFTIDWIYPPQAPLPAHPPAQVPARCLSAAGCVLPRPHPLPPTPPSPASTSDNTTIAINSTTVVANNTNSAGVSQEGEQEEVGVGHRGYPVRAFPTYAYSAPPLYYYNYPYYYNGGWWQGGEGGRRRRFRHRDRDHRDD
jgi:hypothetical protein